MNQYVAQILTEGVDEGILIKTYKVSATSPIRTPVPPPAGREQLVYEDSDLFDEVTQLYSQYKKSVRFTFHPEAEPPEQITWVILE